MEEEQHAVDKDATGEARWRIRGVPVKAMAVATTRARRRAVMADLVVAIAVWVVPVLWLEKQRGAEKRSHVVECVSEAKTDNIVCPSV